MPTQLGVRSLLIRARTASFTGTFYSAVPKTDEDIRSAASWVILMSLTADTWRNDVASNATYRQVLVQTLLASNRLPGAVGYGNAMHAQISNYSDALVRLLSNTSVEAAARARL